jgi:serine/threonine protein kinase
MSQGCVVGVYIIGVLNAKFNDCRVERSILTYFCQSSALSLCLRSITMLEIRKQKLRRPSEKRYLPLKLDFVRVGGRYRIGKLLGSGRSGEPNSEMSWKKLTSSSASVYLGKDIGTGAEIAVKIGRTDNPPSTLRYEYDVYKTAAGSIGIPAVCWYGKEGYHEVIVMEYLGTSLGDLIKTQNIDHNKTFYLASQMVRSLYTYRDLIELFPQLSAVESLHTRHYIHCDIKPGNIMIRVDNMTAFLIDFGSAELFRDPATHLHIPYSMDQSIVGTLPFMSVNCQEGHAQSRRDDIESLAYTIICAARGDLPWTSPCTLRDPEAVLQKKLSSTVEELCEGLPAPFCEFISHVRSLNFDQKPDYQYLHSILSQCSQTETDQPDKSLLASAPSVGLDSDQA